MNVQLPRFADAGEAFAWFAGASAQAAVLIVAVLALRAALGRRLTPGWRLALWLTVLLRLVVPLAVESRWSLAALGRRVASSITRGDGAIATAKPRAASGGPRVSITYGPVPSVAPPAVAPRVAVRSATRWSTRETVVVAWIAGVLAMSAREAIGAIRLGRVVRPMRSIDDPTLLALAARCAREVGVRRRVRLVETDRVRAPAVCGVVRPTILLPLDVSRTLSAAELRLVLLHELVHVRRDDPLVGAIARLVRAMHWFNPFVWIGANAFRADRELAADAAVLRAIGDDERRTYGECLLRVVAHVSGTPRHAATLGLFGSSRRIQRRIDMIAHESTSLFSRVGRGATGMAVLLAIAGVAALAEPTTRPAADDATLARLDRPIQALDLGGKTLEQAVDAIAKAGAVPLRVEWDALAAVGVSRLSPAKTTSLKNVKPVKALQIVFDGLGPAGGGPARFDYEVADGAVVFSTAADIAKRFGGATRTFALDLPPDRARNEQVATLIVDTIDSDSWKRNGGTGEIEARDTELVVTHTPRRLAEVARMIDQLNATRGTSRAPMTAAVVVPAAGAATRPGTVAADATAADAALSRVLPELRFDGVPLTDAIDFLRDTTAIPFFVNWTAIERAGVPRTVPVSVRLKDVKLGKALSIILDAAGGGRVKLGHTIDEGVVTISTRDDLAVNVETRTYDVRDLLIEIPDFQAPAATQPATTRPTRDERVRQLIDVIKSTVESDSWKSNGGLIGAIQELSGQLIITTTPATQTQIESLLVQLRRGRSIQVNVEARFVAADPSRLADLLGGRAAATIGKAKETAGVFLDDAAAASLLRAVQLGEIAETLTAPRVTLFNGQRVFVKVAQPQAYIADFTLTQTAAGERRFEPRVQEAESGITLEMEAVVSADHKYVTLTLKPQLSRLVRLESEPFAGDPKSGLSVQRPTIETQEMRTTVSVPDRGTLLLSIGQMSGGLPFKRTDATVLATTRDSPRQLLLLIRPTVIVQREDEPTTAPSREK